MIVFAVNIENHMHSTVAIHGHKKESRHSEQTLTHTQHAQVIHYGKYMYSVAMA